MGHRLSKIYTRTGDKGTTGLGDGERVNKDAARIEACGAVDELNSAIGVVLATGVDDRVASCLGSVQHDLFDLGGELAIPGSELLPGNAVARLERTLDAFNAELGALKEFILPGGGPAASHCHLARAICRRAERRLVSLAGEETVGVVALKYLNRLSDLLFVIARRLAIASGYGEVLWDHERRR